MVLPGSLTPSLMPGDVLVPTEVSNEGGETVRCDPDLVAALSLAAEQLGLKVDSGRLLSASRIVTGSDRQRWADMGFAAADMETIHFACTRKPLAAVRVILDAPTRPISDEWMVSSRALLHPRLWRELAWMAVRAPRYSWRAASVVRGGLEQYRPRMPKP